MIPVALAYGRASDPEQALLESTPSWNPITSSKIVTVICGVAGGWRFFASLFLFAYKLPN
jgi:hypothetical protein